MGHERLSLLPKTKKWKEVVEDISQFDDSNVVNIASKTIDNIRLKFNNLYNDNGVLSAFRFLVILSYSFSTKEPLNELKKQNINIPDNYQIIYLSRRIKEWVEEKQNSLEYSHFSSLAAIEAITGWYKYHDKGQHTFFEPKDNFIEILGKTGNGSGFCELSRLYFSNYIEHYLKYYLEREASTVIWDIGKRLAFNKRLEESVKDVSLFAFETSKITQSFSAGWFNKVIKNGLPKDKVIKNFLRLAFSKIIEEFTRDREET
jgi:hypothetical protein